MCFFLEVVIRKEEKDKEGGHYIRKERYAGACQRSFYVGEGVKEEDIPFLAKSAMADACTPGNPRDVTQPEIEDIYKSIY